MGPRVRGDDIGLETVRLRRVRGFVSRTAQREGVARGIGDDLSVHFAKQPNAADDGLITKPSKYSVEETVARFEAAVKQKEAAGFTVFTEIDHAAAARKFGLEMRPRTVILFGNPKVGTPSVIKTPLVAIDLPPKALVWEDDQGKVWLSYNSADYLFNTLYKRHGAEAPAATAPIAKVLDEMSDQATK